MKGMCRRKSNANRFHVLELFSDKESEVDEVWAGENCHDSSPVCFGDYLAIAEDRRGSCRTKGIMKQKVLESQNRKENNTRRGTSSVGLDHRSNASL
jgi:hypothetical protein